VQVGVTNLTKFFDSPEGPVAALRGIDFQIAAGEFYTLLGPSGCGKSTTLRCIAGLESPNDGEITIGEEIVSAGGRSTPANLRPIGMVFQSYAIWPHMTVFNNVAFPLKQARSRVPRAERRARVMEALALVKMEELADRPSPYLSGGQQQRVALARAACLQARRPAAGRAFQQSRRQAA
jgi:iron(III) transport system ATP-binding protein